MYYFRGYVIDLLVGVLDVLFRLPFPLASFLLVAPIMLALQPLFAVFGADVSTGHVIATAAITSVVVPLVTHLSKPSD